MKDPQLAPMLDDIRSVASAEWPGEALVTGQVVEVNTRLADHPEFVNDDPFGDGWMLRVELADPSQLDRLMDAGAYAQQIGRT